MVTVTMCVAVTLTSRAISILTRRWRIFNLWRANHIRCWFEQSDSTLTDTKSVTGEGGWINTLAGMTVEQMIVQSNPYDAWGNVLSRVFYTGYIIKGSVCHDGIIWTLRWFNRFLFVCDGMNDTNIYRTILDNNNNLLVEQQSWRW